MKKHSTKIDLSNELAVEPYQGGVRLIRPSNDAVTVARVQDLLSLPINVIFLDSESRGLLTNDVCAEINGFQSKDDMINRTVMDYTEANSAHVVLGEDKKVLRERAHHFFETHVSLIDGRYFDYLSFKSPFMNEDNQVAGVFCCAVAVGVQPLAETLAVISKMGLLACGRQLMLPGNITDEVYLSKRESDCLRWLVRGKTAKEIGKIVGLSFRTVEQHVANMKSKFDVRSKSELIDRTIDLFLR